MYDPKQKLNIFSKNTFFFFNTMDFRGSGESGETLEKKIGEFGLGI